MWEEFNVSSYWEASLACASQLSSVAMVPPSIDTVIFIIYYTLPITVSHQWIETVLLYNHFLSIAKISKIHIVYLNFGISSSQLILFSMKFLFNQRRCGAPTTSRITRITPGNSGQSNSVLAENHVANAVGSSYSVLFTFVTSQHKRMPRYLNAFRGGFDTARRYKHKRMPLEILNLLSKKLLWIFTNLKWFLTTYFILYHI